MLSIIVHQMELPKRLQFLPFNPYPPHIQAELLLDMLYQGLGQAGLDGTRHHLGVVLEQLVYDACASQDIFALELQAYQQQSAGTELELSSTSRFQAGYSSSAAAPVTSAATLGSGDSSKSTATAMLAWWKSLGIVSNALRPESTLHYRAMIRQTPEREGDGARMAMLGELLDSQAEDVVLEAAAFLQHVAPRTLIKLIKFGFMQQV